MPATHKNGRWLITGAHGQLGRELCRLLGQCGTGLDRAHLDITDADAVSRRLHFERPDVVVNTAAWTNVDAAEDPVNRRQCFRVNAEAVQFLADACDAVGSLLVQVSTDYVFGRSQNRQDPYTESDQCEPVNVYGESKLAGEVAAASLSKHLIVRTSGLYAASANGPVRGRNFADTMQILGKADRPLRVVADQHCTPSFVPDVAEAIVKLVEAGGTGIVHVVNHGQTTWHGFTEELFRQQGIERTVEPIATSEYPTPAPRPLYSVLATDRYKEITRQALPPWQTGITRYLEENSS